MNHCEIVRDLLPLYIEDITAPGTTEYMREHLSCCPECMEAYRRMTIPAPPLPDPNEKWKSALEAQRKAEKKQKRRSILLWGILLFAILALSVPQLKHYIDTHKTTPQKVTTIEAEEILTLCPTVVPTEEELYFLTRISALPILTESDRLIQEEELLPFCTDLIPPEASLGYIDGNQYYLIIEYFVGDQYVSISYTDKDMDGTFELLTKFVHPGYQEDTNAPYYSATYYSHTATTIYEKHQ